MPQTPGVRGEGAPTWGSTFSSTCGQLGHAPTRGILKNGNYVYTRGAGPRVRWQPANDLTIGLTEASTGGCQPGSPNGASPLDGASAGFDAEGTRSNHMHETHSAMQSSMAAMTRLLSSASLLPLMGEAFAPLLSTKAMTLLSLNFSRQILKEMSTGKFSNWWIGLVPTGIFARSSGGSYQAK